MAKDIYIYPSKKSRRVLITISDLLISFIVTSKLSFKEKYKTRINITISRILIIFLKAFH